MLFPLEITPDFRNKRHFRLFGLNLVKLDLNISFPDYIVVCSAKLKSSTGWRAIDAMGKERSGDSWFIRLFSRNINFSVFKTNSV